MLLLRLLAVLGVFGLWLAMPAAAEQREPQRVSRVNAGWPVADFALVDETGNPFTREHLLGRWTFVLFGDAHCAEPCAEALAALTGMCDRIARTQKLQTTQIVFITVAADTPDKLRQYLARFGACIAGATGAPEAVRQLVDDLGASAGAGVLALVDPEGNVWGQFLPPFDVKQLTARYLRTRLRP